MKYRIVLLTLVLILLSLSGSVLAADRPATTGGDVSHVSPALQQDVTPPNTVLTVGNPQHLADDILWVSARTSHALAGVDNVDPSAALQTSFRFYRTAAVTDAPAFRPYNRPFNLSGPDGRYRVEFRSQDTSGNVEEINSQVEHLDSTAPRTTWTVGEPVFYDDFGQAWITNETLQTLEAIDSAASDGTPGSGVAEIRYRIEGAPAGPSSQDFSLYEAPFTVDGPDGQYDIDFFATDNVENQAQTQTVQAFLDTLPPALDIGGPYVGEEGSEFTFDASGTVDAGSGLVEIIWDLDGDATFDDASGPTATQTYGDNGLPFIGIQASDNLGHTDLASTQVEVQNAAPAVSITGLSTTQPYPGQMVTLEGSFTDAGWLDTHTAMVDWGDGETTEATVSELNEAPEATGTFTAQHSFAAMGPFNITVTVTDDDGGSNTASTQVQVGLSSQMPGSLIADDELAFYRLTATTPGTWGNAQWQWRSGTGNPRLWWIAEDQGWLFLFLKTSNDAPYYDPQRPTEPWSNFLTIAVRQENFQKWFWCGIYLYDEYRRTIGIGCHPEYSPPPEGAGILHPWVAQRMEQSEEHVINIVRASLQ